MLNAVIIDDEHNSRITMGWLLETYCPQVHVVGMGKCIESGVKAIKELKPDLVFLDIQLTSGTGFDILTHFPTPEFDVVFVTAFDRFAIEAIKTAALDYLLKPVQVEELKKTVNRAMDSNNRKSLSQNIEVLMNNLTPASEMTRLAVPLMDGFVFLPVDEIIWLESNGAYTNFHLSGGKKILSSKKLNDFELLAETGKFYRIHRSSIINLQRVEKYVKGRGGQVFLDNGTELEVAKPRKEGLLKALNIRWF